MLFPLTTFAPENVPPLAPVRAEVCEFLTFTLYPRCDIIAVFTRFAKARGQDTMHSSPRACLNEAFADAEQAGAIEPGPMCNTGMQVTLVLRHRVAQHVVSDYELWLARIGSAVQDAPGGLGAHVIRPLADAGDYMFVPRFEDAAQLARWCASARCVALLAEVDRLLQVSPPRAKSDGSFAWFGLSRVFARLRRA
jgi:quinol monooxygenase YgiN